MVEELLKNGHEVVVYDSLIYGHKEALPKNCELIIGDLENISLLEKIFEERFFDAAMHFAAFISMGESMENPRIYFRNNVFNTLNLIDTLVKFQVRKFIFSSSAGVYGNPVTLPIPEDHPTNPTNPYGETKLMVEKILKWYEISYGLKSVSLRYFNAAGASLDGHIG
ncbi:MAG: NAD-dependent epimerase/dehydratase family protein, partial [Patescibacteria group bacterium]